MARISHVGNATIVAFGLVTYKETSEDTLHKKVFLSDKDADIAFRNSSHDLYRLFEDDACDAPYFYFEDGYVPEWA
jgi:hypothetical protein